MKIQVTYNGKEPFSTPEKQRQIEKILSEAFMATPEYKEVVRQCKLALEADMDLKLYGKSAVVMDGDKIVRVINPNSEEFPQ